ncbi:MAG: RING finger domain-containing protein [Promethearchaeota archaeon]
MCHEYIGLNNNNTIRCPFCGSQYHSKCITSWLQKHNTCPLCLNIYIIPETVATSVRK